MFRPGARLRGVSRRAPAFIATLLLVLSALVASSSHSLPGGVPVWTSYGGPAATQVDVADHSLLRTLALPDGVRAMAVDPYDRSLWVLTETRLMQFSPAGPVMVDTSLAAYLDQGETNYRPVLNPYGGNLWVGAGHVLLRLNPQGTPDVVTRLPDPVLHAAMGFDETLWVLTRRELIAFSPNGQIVRRATLAALGFADKPDSLAVDTLGEALWLAGPRLLARIDTATFAAPVIVRAQPAPLPQFISPLALNAFSGEVWLASGDALHVFGRGGNPVRTILLSPLAIKKPRNLAFEPQTETFWLGANGGLVAHFSANGSLLGTLVAGADTSGRTIFGVMPAQLLPTVKLQSPASGSVLTQPYTDIHLTLGASCNSRPCDPGDDYLEAFVLDFTLDGVAIPSSSWTIAGSDAVYSPGALSEGEIVLDGTATDFLNHASAALHDSFFIDLPPVIAVTSPVDGALTNQPQQTLLGFVNEPVTLTLNGDPLAAPPPTQQFTKTLTLGEGLNSYTLIATDSHGSQATYSFSLTLDSTPPEAPTAELGELADGQITVSGTAEAGSTVTVTNLRTNTTQAIASNGTYSVQIAAQAGDTIRVVVTDAAGNTSTATDTQLPNPPSGPVLNPPPIDPTVTSLVFIATEFLYTGSNPVQTGVAPGTIEPQRAAVLRGKVLARDNTPLAGVTVKIHNHPEFGQTLTRADGMFDMAVNGGGVLTLDYVKDGFLPVQRQLDAPWQDFALADDVVMIPLDGRVTTIAANATTMQVAQGNPVTDADGTRTATILFPAGTTATMMLPDGSTQPLAALNVRATEYTVGANGPAAMPAGLPPTSAYTYAVELSADEAIAAGARDIAFSQPVPVYVDNFPGFPVGGIVPAGYYDAQQAAWVPQDNGRVVAILSIVNNRAQLDTNGDAQADTAAQLAALGITDAEQQTLATLYPVGKTLWRVPVAHFSPWDFNWPWAALMADAVVPQVQAAVALLKPVDKPCECSGSIIESENRVLGERLGIAGTPFALNYRSDRVPGRKANVLDIPLSGATVPASARRFVVQVTVAGRRFSAQVAAAPNQRYRFEWDGNDAYGRRLQGAQPVTVKVGYVYGGVYGGASTQSARSFAMAGSGTVSVDMRTREFTLWQTTRTTLGAWDARAVGLGGWTLDAQHQYDLNAKVLYLGNGERRGLETRSPSLRHIVPIGPDRNFHGMAVGPDGTVYVASYYSSRVYRMAPDGTLTVVAGTGSEGFSGDGGPATSARLDHPRDVALGPDGSLYIADSQNHRIRKVALDGTISTVAGSGVNGSSGDGGAATLAGLSSPFAVAVGPDSSLYIAGAISMRIRKVSPDGIISTYAGTGVGGFSGDGGPARQARLGTVYDLALDADGSLYIADLDNDRIRKVTSDGLIATVAGNGIGGYAGDGGPATQARLNNPQGVTPAPGGGFYIGDSLNYRVRYVNAAGLITTVAGNGTGANTDGQGGDGGPATRAQLHSPIGVGVGPDNSLYIATAGGNSGINRVRPELPGFTATDSVLASEDGSELYHLDAFGRHLRTLNTYTGAVVFTFGYTASGLLSQITDGDGDITRIERTGAVPTAIVSADGHRTALTLDANGFLATAANPALETHRMTYTADGLLTRFEDPRTNASTMSYDADGLLEHDENAAGGFWAIVGSGDTDSRSVQMTTAEGRVTQYLTESLATGDQRRTTTAADGTATVSLLKTDGSQQTTLPDGTVTTTVAGPDPRWNMQAPLTASASTKTPSGLTANTTTTRTVTQANALDPLSLTAETTITTVNGRAFRTEYAAATRQYTFTSPRNRVTTLRTDVQGRPVFTQVPGIDATNYAYDTRGRLTGVTQGSGATLRSLVYGYGADGFVSTITDAQSRQTLYQRDAVGRITQATLPGSRVIGTAYDAAGNVTGITPPGQPEHRFAYSAVNLAETYTPPTVSGVSTPQTQYAYNRDKQLTSVVRPDGVSLVLDYDTGGRLATLTPSANAATISYGYHATTGQLATVSTPQQTLAYSWDGFLLRDEALSGTVSGTISRNYDSSFRTTQISVNGSAVSLGYDNDDLLTSAGSLTLSRNAGNGLLTATTLGSVTTANTYNAFGELATHNAKHGSSTLFATSYTYDTLGRIATRAETVQGITSNTVYGYDLAGRLQTVTKNGVQVESYSYDANGNRMGGTYDDQDRLLAYGANTYTWTANGELQSKTVGGPSGPTTAYTYGVYGNLQSVTLPDGTPITYLADGRNRRIGKQVNGVTTQGFLYQDQLRIAAELDGSNNVVSRFVYGTKINVPEYMVKSGTTYRIVTDHLGSVRLVVDTVTGAIAQRMDYDSFGNVTSDTNPGFQPFGFAGGLYDTDTKLVRFGARDYDAETGRWTAKDPIGFGGKSPNLFAYAANDPVNFVDPDGKVIWVAGGAIAGAVFGAAAGAAQAIAGGGDIGAVGMAALTGGASGAVSGALVMASLPASAAVSGILAGASDVTNQVAAGGCINWGRAATQTFIGVLSGAVGSRAGLKVFDQMASPAKVGSAYPAAQFAQIANAATASAATGGINGLVPSVNGGY